MPDSWPKPLISTLGLKKPSGAHFDEEAASRACDFFRLLPHVEGEFAGKPFVLERWQEEELIRPMFGWMRADGRRLYREVYLEIPRGNGKSSLGAGINGKLTFADSEPGAQNFCAAADRDQARVVFRQLANMVKASPELSKKAKVEVGNIFYPKTNSVFRVLSSEVGTKHGLNVHGCVIDELHIHPKRELADVLLTGTRSRRQPLVVYLTTAGTRPAGTNDNNICWEKHEYTLRVANGIVDDPAWLGVIYAAEDTDDWTAEETWYKANPNLGVTVDLGYIRRECEKAKVLPAYENTFKNLHLDLWTAQSVRWISLDTWDRSAGMVDPAKLEGRECYAGIHLASTKHAGSLVLLFVAPDGSYDVLPYFFIPEAAVKNSDLENASWAEWAKQGFVEITRGNVTDYDAIHSRLSELAKTFQVEEVGFNPQNAIQFTNDLEDSGLDLRPAVPTFGTLNAATKELERAVLDGKLRHGGNPVLRYMADAAAVELNAEGNIKLSQKLSMGNISGLQALVQAMNCAERVEDSTPSIIVI